MLINKRPISYKRVLTNEGDCSILPITPEILIHGYEIPSVPIIPQLIPNDVPLDDSPYDSSPSQYCESLRRVLSNLQRLYYDEFLECLRHQSTNLPNRYKKSSHDKVYPGDLILLKEKYNKPFSCPMAVIKSVETNNLDEVVAVVARKGSGAEVRRHITDVVLLMRSDEVRDLEVSESQEEISEPEPRMSRKSKTACMKRNQSLLNQGLV